MQRILSAQFCVVFCLLLSAYGCDDGGGGGQAGAGGSAQVDMMTGGTDQTDMGMMVVDQGQIIMPCVTDNMCPEDKYCRMGQDGLTEKGYNG